MTSSTTARWIKMTLEQSGIDNEDELIKDQSIWLSAGSYIPLGHVGEGAVLELLKSSLLFLALKYL